MSLLKRLNAALVAVVCLAGAAVFANGQKVRVAADPAVDLSKYKTYTWASGLAGTNPIVNQQIVAAVDSQLAAKGLTKVETEPELTLSAWVWTESDMHVVNPSWAPPLNSISTGIAVGSQSWPVTKGTLVVDIADSKSKNGIWRGTASDTLKHGPSGDKAKDAKSAEKPIRKAVEKMFKQFPKPSR